MALALFKSNRKDQEVDESTCPICKTTTYIGKTIQCDKCYHWLHYKCAGVTKDDPRVLNQEEQFFCEKCFNETGKKMQECKKKQLLIPGSRIRKMGEKLFFKVDEASKLTSENGCCDSIMDEKIYNELTAFKNKKEKDNEKGDKWNYYR